MYLFSSIGRPLCLLSDPASLHYWVCAGKSAFLSSRRTSMNDILQRVQKVEDKETEVRRVIYIYFPYTAV